MPLIVVLGHERCGAVGAAVAVGHRFPYGDYLELTVDSAGVSQLIWGEGLSFTGPGGTWYTRGR